MAALVIAGLGVGLFYVVVVDSELRGPVPTLAGALPPQAGVGSAVTVTLGAPDRPSAVQSVTTTSKTVPLRSVTSLAVTTPPVVTAMRAALSAWGRFAVTGLVRDLDDHFVAGGPQRRQLRAEAESIRADPPGAPPYVVTTGDIVTISATPTDIVLRAEIEWARQGEQTQFFVWDIQMRLADGRWQILTIDNVGEEEPG